ncbi:hypothetical protein SAFG77S_00892 [Streptomyces afghaniensis]
MARRGPPAAGTWTNRARGCAVVPLGGQFRSGPRAGRRRLRAGRRCGGRGRLVRRYLARARAFVRLTYRAGGRSSRSMAHLLAEDASVSTTVLGSWTALGFDHHLRYVGCSTILAMDLEQLGAPEARRVLPRPSTASTPATPHPLPCGTTTSPTARLSAPKVSLIQARQGAPDAATASRRLVSTTLRHLGAPDAGRGLPGSGKSPSPELWPTGWGSRCSAATASARSGGKHPASSLRPPTTARALTPEWTARTYATLLDRASALLSSGESVVLDATWSDAGQREAALLVADAPAPTWWPCTAMCRAACQQPPAWPRGPPDAGLDIATAHGGQGTAMAGGDRGRYECAGLRGCPGALAAPAGAPARPRLRRPYMEPDSERAGADRRISGTTGHRAPGGHQNCGMLRRRPCWGLTGRFSLIDAAAAPPRRAHEHRPNHAQYDGPPCGGPTGDDFPGRPHIPRE